MTDTTRGQAMTERAENMIYAAAAAIGFTALALFLWGSVQHKNAEQAACEASGGVLVASNRGQWCVAPAAKGHDHD